MPWTLDLVAVDHSAIPAVGGKGANLGEMLHTHLPVPPGFVVTTDAYRRFLEANDLAPELADLLAHLDVDDPTALEEASRKVARRIISRPLPAEVASAIRKALRDLDGATAFAVRSSATMEDSDTTSFAGMNRTLLNVQGEDAVLEAVRSCWASLYGARVLFYMAKQGIADAPEMGVVVQAMVPSEKSGVMFTLEPTTGDRDVLVIEAARGLGEVVVGGQVETDTYTLAKADLAIKARECGKQAFKLVGTAGGGYTRVALAEQQVAEPVLSDAELRTIGQLGLDVERHYGIPQDVEWAIAGGKAYLVQTRPITTFGRASSNGKPGRATGAPAPMTDGKALARGRTASPGLATGRARVLGSPREAAGLAAGEILVTHMTSPDWVPVMRRAAAIVTESGGMTSHAAIVSRELGVPCIVGARGATTAIQDGAFVTVDATHGQVVAASEAQAAAPKQAMPAPAPTFAPLWLAEPTATSLYLNLGEPARAEELAKLPVDGVGLMRAEFMILEALVGRHPRQLLDEGKGGELRDAIASGMRTIARAFHPRPVIYRAMDFKTNEFRGLAGGERYEPVEANPMIGYRGCFRYLREPDLFRVECEALAAVRAEGHDHLYLMLPFGRTRWEVERCIALVRESGLMADRHFQLWLMAEVPSVVYWLPEYIQAGIQGVSIGSNDLTQLILGVDRDGDVVAPVYDERDPAVLEAIRQIVTTCRRLGVPCSICGQAPSLYPDYAEKLVEWGIRSVSVNPDAVDVTRRHIATAERRMLLDRARAER